MTKYIFITGGVVSGIGKGVAASSMAQILESYGYSVSLQKCDPYINVDPGTMSPYQHGEVYVTADGGETDLDLGHYERFTSAELTKLNNITTGQIYEKVIARERKGDFLGSTVQVIPHVTDAIKDCIHQVAKIKKPDFLFVEIGGTVGDIESLPFIEAARQMVIDHGSENVMFVHTTLLPLSSTSNELKTKPTQHSVRNLQSHGINTNLIILRSEKEISQQLKQKIALHTGLRLKNIISASDSKTIYEVPLNFKEQDLGKTILDYFHLKPRQQNTSWSKFVNKISACKKVIRIGLVGKYVVLKDAYLSIQEALKISGWCLGVDVEIVWIHSEDLSPSKIAILKNLNGIIVPGGFGQRGIFGKMLACEYARKNNIPYLGICYGMQVAIIEFLRNVVGIKTADTTENNPDTSDPVIDILKTNHRSENLGGTLRLGNYTSCLVPGSLAEKFYGGKCITERHRHRYELNNKYRPILEKHGMHITGNYGPDNLAEIIELKNHPFFMGCQFHPEFTARPLSPNPLFTAFLKASL